MKASNVKKQEDSSSLITDVNGLPIGKPYRSGELWIGNGEKLAVKYYMVEVLFRTGASIPSSINVPLNNSIQGFLLTSFYWSIEAYSAATLGKLPSGNTPIPQLNFTSSYITLQDNKAIVFWQNKPLRDLQTINDTATVAGKQYVDSLGGVVINWQNANILISDTTELATSTTYSIPLGLAFSFNANYQEDGVGAGTYATSGTNN